MNIAHVVVLSVLAIVIGIMSYQMEKELEFGVEVGADTWSEHSRNHTSHYTTTEGLECVLYHWRDSSAGISCDWGGFYREAGGK